MTDPPLWRRYARLFGPDPVADVHDELQFHLQAKADDLIEQGWQPSAARREAERQFGDLRTVQHIGKQLGETMERQKQWHNYWNDSAQDLRYTLRALRRDPTFAVISILILMLAIGANIAVFSVINTLMLRPLPFTQAQQLVWIAPPPTKCGFSCATFSADAYEQFRRESRSYQDVTGYFAFSTADNSRLTGHGLPLPLTSMDVIANFFQVLGVRPAMGRLFTPEEARNGARLVTLLSDAYWRHQFSADPEIVGKAIDLNGTPVTIVGVLPPTFDFGAVFSPGTRVDLFTPLNLDDARNEGNIVTMIGRLHPDKTLAQAQAEVKLVSPHMCGNARYPRSCGVYATRERMTEVFSLKEYISGKLRSSLIVLWSAVGAILLIACVNLSNLLLARAAARGREFALRGALGASRGRVIRQLLAEALLLSGTGALLGLALAFALVTWLAHQGSIALPLLSTLRIDGTALIWTLLIAILAAVLFGLLPGIRMAGTNLSEAMKDSSPGSGQGRRHERVRSALVISEITLACVLLLSAGLLLRSFLRVLDVDLGFQPQNAAAIKVDYNEGSGSDADRAARRAEIFRQIIERVSALPGVKVAGMVDYLPFGRNRSWGPPVPKGRSYRENELPEPLVYVSTPGFLPAMGTRIQGRDFTWADGPKSEKVILLNRTATDFLWPGGDALDKIVSVNGTDRRIVGIVDDVHEDSIEASAGWQMYFPATQEGPNGAFLVLRSTLSPAALNAVVLHTLRELNPNQPTAELAPIRVLVDHAVSPRRFFMVLVAGFAGLGLVLAALGIYGVISYSVTRQTQAIGVRMALGASLYRVRRDVLLSTLPLVVIGLAIGTILAIGSAHLLASLLFATSPWDIVSYTAMVVILFFVALISGYLPARRASRINPMTALRSL